MEKSLADIKKVFEPRLFKYEVLIAFWLAVHLQKLSFAQLLAEQDPIVRSVIDTIWSCGQAALQEKKEKVELEKRQARQSVI